MNHFLRKRTFSFFLSLFFSLTLFSQVPLKPLYEEFTSATCGPCATVNELIDPIFAANEETHTLIKYQADWPGVGDPYYIEESGYRIDYYEVIGVPSFHINGVKDPTPSFFTQANYDANLNEQTYMSIDIIEAEINTDFQVDISVDINALGDYPAGLKAYVAIIEKSTVNNFFSNGETSFNNVVMEILTGGEGLILPAMSNGDTETLDFTTNMSTTFMEGPDDLKVVVFIQDDSDMSIIQSENQDIAGEFAKYDLTFNVKDSEGNPVIGAEIFLSDQGTQYTVANGVSVFESVFEAEMEYKVTYPGLIDAVASVTIIGADQTIDIVLDIPDYFFYEDFAFDFEPDWTGIKSLNDAVYWYDGVAIVFRQSGTENPLMFISPPLNISSNNGGDIFFNLGGVPEGSEIITGFGTIADPTDPASISELASFEPVFEYETFQFDLSDLAAGTEPVQFYWSYPLAEFGWFYMDYMYITMGTVGTAELEALESANVHPNPASDLVNISLDHEIKAISIYDNQARLIREIDLNVKEYKLNTSSYPSGLYSILIKSENGQIMKTIAIEN